jgi:hypothetical protein
MKALLAQLAARRAALVDRSGAQRRDLGQALAGARRGIEEPLALGFAAALALAGASPRARAWLVRAWVIGALVRRLLR